MLQVCHLGNRMRSYFELRRGSHFEGIVPRRHRLGRCPDQQGSLVEGSVTPIPIRIFLFPSLGLLSLWRWDLAFYREGHAVGARLKQLGVSNPYRKQALR